MNCPKCNAEVSIRSTFCPQCGSKVEVQFGAIAEQVHDDYAVERGLKIERALKWTATGLGILCFMAWCVTYAFDRPLRFDFAEIPSLPANAVLDGAEMPTIATGIVEPRPNPPLSYAPVRIFAQRSERIRLSLVMQNKGSNETEGAIAKGLTYLAGIQSADGGFPVAHFPADFAQSQTKDFQWGRAGVTGLALLAFLGNGHCWVPLEEKPSRYGLVTERAVRYLLAQQTPSGIYGPDSGASVDFMYNQGMVTLAMVEAAGISGDDHVRKSAQRAIDFIIAAQTPQGGWNFTGDPKGEDDTNVSSWQVQALVTAKEAGFKVPDETLQNALNLFQSATKGDRVVYRVQRDDNRDTLGLVGLGLTMRNLLGEDTSSPQLKQLAAKILSRAPQAKAEWGRNWRPRVRKDDDERNLYDPYLMYYCTYGMFFQGGPGWEAWNERMIKSVCRMQDNDGCWRTTDVYSSKAGVAYSTALSILTLQVYYRITNSWAPDAK